MKKIVFRLFLVVAIAGMGLTGYLMANRSAKKAPVGNLACEIYGKIKIVDYGEDYKVKKVDYGQDVKIKWVDYGEDKKGRWKEVDYSEDYKIKWVDYGEDFQVKFVDYGEGC